MRRGLGLFCVFPVPGYRAVPSILLAVRSFRRSTRCSASISLPLRLTAWFPFLPALCSDSRRYRLPSQQTSENYTHCITWARRAYVGARGLCHSKCCGCQIMTLQRFLAKRRMDGKQGRSFASPRQERPARPPNFSKTGACGVCSWRGFTRMLGEIMNCSRSPAP